ncbi:MAG: hypothetical protein ACNA8W_02880 [Bradymonadaceae bacterium]
MSDKDRPGSGKSRKGGEYDDLETRPRRHPVELANMLKTIKVEAVSAEATVELDQVDLIVEDAPTELMNRDEVLRNIKHDRGEVESKYSKPTIRVPAIEQETVPDRPSTLGVEYSNNDAHLRITMDMEDNSRWVEFVAEVDKNGCLMVPVELIRIQLFKPGQRLMIRVHGLDD